MHVVGLCRCHEDADLLQPLRREPALASPPLDREAVGRLFIGAAELMAALVRVNPHLHDGRYLGQQPGVEDRSEERRVGKECRL